jgi:hypothetical protein
MDRAPVYSRRGVHRRVTDLYSVTYRYIVLTRMERSIRHLMRFPSVLKSALRLATLAASTQAFSSLVIAGPAVPQLTPPTIEAFNDYVRLTEARNDAELKRGSGLLWVDGLPGSERAQAYDQLRRGEVKMRKLETLKDGVPIRCPDGMIHHWVGLAFIPGAKLADVLGVLEDYNRHAIYYAPDVERSEIESRDGDHFRVFLRFRRHKVVTVVLDTEHDVRYFRDSETRAHSRSSAVRIAQVENAGKRDEREKATGDDDGFLWRMETWWRMIEADGGVYVQSEVASLTRDIPAGLAWLIGPFVTSIPKESLAFTLEATRKTVAAKSRN